MRPIKGHSEFFELDQRNKTGVARDQNPNLNSFKNLWEIVKNKIVDK